MQICKNKKKEGKMNTKINPDNLYNFKIIRVFNLVGVTRFELATPRPPDGYATKLRYTPDFMMQK